MVWYKTHSPEAHYVCLLTFSSKIQTTSLVLVEFVPNM